MNYKGYEKNSHDFSKVQATHTSINAVSYQKLIVIKYMNE
jgi:hypothetical protein